MGHTLATKFGLAYVGELHRIRRWGPNGDAGPKPRCRNCGPDCEIWTEDRLVKFSQLTTFQDLGKLFDTKGVVDSSKTVSWFTGLDDEYVTSQLNIFLTKHPLRHLSSFFDHQSNLTVPVELTHESKAYAKIAIGKLLSTEQQIRSLSKKLGIAIPKLKYEDVILDNVSYYELFTSEGFMLTKPLGADLHPLGGNVGAHTSIRIINAKEKEKEKEKEKAERRIEGSKMSNVSGKFYSKGEMLIDDKYTKILSPALVEYIINTEDFQRLLSKYDYPSET